MNSHGASLASDSAVTFGDQRTYNTVNKIFPLGGKDSGHRITFMISGGARHLPTGMLWERIFGLFYEDRIRAKQPTEFDTVDCYVREFQDYLNTKHNLPSNAPANSVSVQDNLRYWFLTMPPVQRRLNEQQTRDQFLDMVGIDHDKLGLQLPSKENLEDFLDSWQEIIDYQQERHDSNEWRQRFLRVEEHHNHNSKFVASDIVDTLDLKPKRGRKDLLRRIFNLQLALSYEPAKQEGMEWVNGSTTIAVAGFGTQDIEPRLIQLKSGFISDPEFGCLTISDIFLIRNRISRDDVGLHEVRCHECGRELNQIGWPNCNDCGEQEYRLHSAPAILRPFAMSSEIQNILNGIHSDFSDLYQEIAEESAEILAIGIVGDLENVSGIGPKTLQTIKKAFENEIKDKVKDFLGPKIRTNIHINGEISRRQEFRRVAATLPIIDLSSFAATLVELQASIDYYLRPIRSVGGDVDLAYITKEDGFVWISRD